MFPLLKADTFTGYLVQRDEAVVIQEPVEEGTRWFFSICACANRQFTHSFTIVSVCMSLLKLHLDIGFFYLDCRYWRKSRATNGFIVNGAK